jgi:hypothetical protein
MFNNKIDKKFAFFFIYVNVGHVLLSVYPKVTKLKLK